MIHLNLSEIDALCAEIRIPDDARKHCLSFGEQLVANEATLSPLMEALLHPKTAEQAQKDIAAFCKQFDEHGFAEMAVMLGAACITRKTLASYGIPDAIYLDTLSCFPRFLQECYDREGYWFFDRGFWVWRQITGVLLRLGALEFEYLPLPEYRATPLRLPVGIPALAVHIPGKTTCTPEALHASYDMRKQYFSPAYLAHLQRDVAPTEGAVSNETTSAAPTEFPVTYCASWLLSERLKELVPTGGIHNFAADFELMETDYRDNSARHWIFNVGPDVTDADLPERTSLQRAAKEVLLRGETIGLGNGILKR